MAKVKYFLKENTKVGTHSFYAVPKSNGTLDFMELCEEACEHTTIEPSILRAAVTEYMKTVKRNVLKGFRCALGEQFIYVYPNLYASIKDEKDAQGNTLKVVTKKDFTLAGAKSRLGASVSRKFSDEFEDKVSWQRVDEQGNVVEEEDITVDPGTNPGGGASPDPGTNTGGNQGGGTGTIDTGGGNDGGD